MLLRYFYDEKLAHASYLVGCQATGEAIVIDPSRDVLAYLQTAKAEGLRIVAAAETHIHADFVSGARELGVGYGATLYLSDEGDSEWKYQYVNADDNRVNHRLLMDGDVFAVGRIEFQVMHTPGHTPESISFLVTDRGGGASQPMGMFTGDFLFVGDVGRPDLLEKAVGMAGTSAQGARQMFASLQRVRELPDYLQVWPAHGAGSACGKALGAVPSSTVGYEKLFNCALRCEDEEIFIETLLQGQPEPPAYFPLMKKLNKEGPTVLSELPVPQTIRLARTNLAGGLAAGTQLLDTRPSGEFAKGHIPGSINIPFNRSFSNWAGWLVDYDRPLYLLTDAKQAAGIVRDLRSIGIDRIAGIIELESLQQWERDELQTYEEVAPADVAGQIEAEDVYLIDVRGSSEWAEGHIPGARHIMLGTLPQRLTEIPTDKPIIVQCRSGARSAIAASVLQANGISNVVNLSGGILRWEKEGLPLEFAADDQVMFAKEIDQELH